MECHWWVLIALRRWEKRCVKKNRFWSLLTFYISPPVFLSKKSHFQEKAKHKAQIWGFFLWLSPGGALWKQNAFLGYLSLIFYKDLQGGTLPVCTPFARQGTTSSGINGPKKKGVGSFLLQPKRLSELSAPDQALLLETLQQAGDLDGNCEASKKTRWIWMVRRGFNLITH